MCGTVVMGIRPDIRPDLGPHCLRRLSADDTGRQIVKQSFLPFMSEVLVFSSSLESIMSVRVG